MGYRQVYRNGTVIYCNDKDQRHRKDGPAVEHGDGTKEWYINGKRHREDGPAVEWASGIKQWWFNGTKYSQKEFEQLPHIKFINQQLKEFDKIQEQGI